MASSWLCSVLEEQSTSRYFIEYNQYYPNHLAHGIIALERLGATEEIVNRFIEWYSSNLDKPQAANHCDETVNADPPSTEEAAALLLGRRKSFYSLLNYYKIIMKECGSMESFVKTCFPKHCEGIAAALLHGLIHIGYGFAARSERVLCEGMAYLHHSYIPLRYDDKMANNKIEHFGKGSTNILEVLKKIKENVELKKIILKGEESSQNTARDASMIQDRDATILGHGDIMIKYANDIKITVDRNPEETDGEFAIRLADWLLDQSIVVFTFSEIKNDFILLHGITGAWSLRQIIPHLDPAVAFLALRSFTCVLLATYAAVECPAIKIRDAEIPVDGQSTWNAIIEKSFTRDGDGDEHVLKVVQVCFECWKSLKDKTSPMAGIYFSAARICVDNEFSFFPR